MKALMADRRQRLTRQARMEARRRRLLTFGGLGLGLFLIGTFLVVRGATMSIWHHFYDPPSAPSTLRLPAGVVQPGRRQDSFAALLDEMRRITDRRHAECGINDVQRARYATLAKSTETILIAAILYQAEGVIPSFIAELPALAAFLSPSRVHVAILENGSSDASPQLLGLLARALDRTGVSYTIRSSGSSESAEHQKDRRIAKLAALRNRVLDALSDRAITTPFHGFDHVVFLNDVHFCATDILELVHQRRKLEATMTTGLDYYHLELPIFKKTGYPLMFYDVWVARDLTGHPVYRINDTGHWDLPSEPFVLDPEASRRRDELLPFQVYSSWNGIAAIDPTVFKPPHSLRFRTVENGGDAQSECLLFSADLWQLGLGRIAVIPRVKVAYTLKAHREAQRLMDISTWLPSEDERIEEETRERIEWQTEPPQSVRSFPFADWSKGVWERPF